MFIKRIFRIVSLLVLSLTMSTCTENAKPRLCLFVGLDISGSFMQSPYFDDALNFMSHYLYAHLNGIQGLEVPDALFVSSIGGAKENEPKTFFPIHTFANKSVDEIAVKLREIFPKKTVNPFTDFNAFFQQVALTVRNKNLVLRPISIVMISDGIPDIKVNGQTDFKSIEVSPLESLSRSVTIRLLYTNAVTGKDWQTKVKRRRVKIWTQDAEVMQSWKEANIMQDGIPFEEQDRLFTWIKDNVDFGVRARRVD